MTCEILLPLQQGVWPPCMEKLSLLAWKPLLYCEVIGNIPAEMEEDSN